MKRRLGWTLVVLLVLACCMAALLTTTQWGLRWTMDRVAGTVPGELHVTTLHGRLIGPVHMEGIEYRQPGHQMVTISTLDLNWHPLSLLDGTLNIAKLEVTGMRYTTAGDSEPQQDRTGTGLPDITLPLKIRLQSAALKNLTIERPGAAPVQINAITLSTSADQRGIHVDNLSVSAPQFGVSLHGTLQPRGVYAMEWHASWTAHAPDMTAVAGSLDISGNLRSLKLAQRIRQPVKADINATVNDVLNNPTWQGHIALREIRTQALQAGLPAATVSANVDLNGNFHSVAARGGISVTENALPVTGRFDLSYKDATLNIKQVKITTADAPTALTVAGRISDVTTKPALDLQGAWQRLRWPLKSTGPVMLSSDNGQFDVHGGLDNYELSLHAPITGAQIPPGTWQIAAQGDPKGLHITNLHVATLDGELSGQGSLTWHPALSWRFDLDGTALNPGSYWKEYPGLLAFTATTQGIMGNQGPQMRVSLDRLDGRIRGYPVQGDTLVSYDAAGLHIHHLSLASDKTRITADGSVDQHWDVRWRVSSPALESLLPGAGGSLQAHGRVSGKSPEPRVNLSVDGEQLSYGGYRADRLQIKGDVDITANRDSSLTINLWHPTFGEKSAAFLRVVASGTRGKHRLMAAIHTDDGVFSATLNGGEHGGAWQGTLDQLQLVNRTTGYWHLKAPAPVTVSRNAVTVEPLCWQRNKAHVCGNAQWHRSGDWNGNVDIVGIPLQWLQGVMPPQVALSGSIDAAVSARQQAHKLSGSGSITLNTASAQLELPNGDHTTFQIKQGTVKAKTQNQHILVSLNLGLSDSGTAQGQFTLPVSALPLPGYAGPQGAPLEGRIQATLTDLSLLPHFIPAVENTRGTLKAVINIGGTVAKPAVNGHAQLSNGSLTIPTLGTQLTQVSITATSDDGQTLTLQGNARSGGGSITVKSDMRLGSLSDQSITLNISSNRFEVVNIPEAWALATADITLQISPKSLEYSGSVIIPEAKLNPRDLSSAVNVSDDAEIVNGSLPQPQTTGRRISGLISIQLGDKVHFTGFGLTAQVKGNLAIQQEPGQPSVGYGTLDVTGEYKAYGQRLTIQQGRLSFVGTPVDNPGLNIKAVRTIKTVTAGIDVLGTMKKPRITLFSDPAMEDTEILSYLILGRPVQDASSQEGERLAGAALALGLSGGEFLAKKINQMFGLNVTVETSSGSFLLGTYLLPDLFVSYEYDVLNAINTLKLRYELSKKWTLEAQSGLYNGADILYTIETH